MNSLKLTKLINMHFVVVTDLKKGISVERDGVIFQFFIRTRYPYRTERW